MVKRLKIQSPRVRPKTKSTILKTKIQSPRIGAYLMSRLRELNMSGVDLIHKLHTKYGKEGGSRPHLYKIMKGEVVAGVGEGELLPKIIKILGLDMNKALELIGEDKIVRSGWKKTHNPNPVVMEVMTIIESLPDEVQEEILQYIKLKANLLK